MQNPMKHKDALLSRFKKAKLHMKQNSQYMTKETQIDVAFLIRDIQNYGFEFFPEHYIEEKINELESISETI